MGHFYTLQGEPVYQVPNLSKGGMRDTTIRDARKLSLVPSVTEILQTVPKPGLDIWKSRQILLAALTLPRLENENDTDFAVRALRDAQEQAEQAADAGRAIHKALLESLDDRVDFDDNMLEYVNLFTTWRSLENNMPEIIGAETVVVNARDRYAGTYDLLGRDPQGRVLLVDIKTRDPIEPKNPGDKPKPRIYDTDFAQLHGYAEALLRNGLVVDRYGILVIGRSKPSLDFIEATDADMEEACHVFEAARHMYCATKKMPGVVRNAELYV